MSEQHGAERVDMDIATAVQIPSANRSGSYETVIHHDALAAYLSLPVPRSITELSGELKRVYGPTAPEPTTLATWSRSEGWESRAKIHDLTLAAEKNTTMSRKLANWRIAELEARRHDWLLMRETARRALTKRQKDGTVRPWTRDEMLKEPRFARLFEVAINAFRTVAEISERNLGETRTGIEPDAGQSVLDLLAETMDKPIVVDYRRDGAIEALPPEAEEALVREQMAAAEAHEEDGLMPPPVVPLAVAPF
jgi:hypothetical protein